MLWNKIEKNNHEKLAYHVWDLLAAKITTTRSLLHRKYPAAWRQPPSGRAPWHMRWSVRREKWTFFQSLATNDVKKNNIPEKFLLTPINNWIVLTVRRSVNYFLAPNSSISGKILQKKKKLAIPKHFALQTNAKNHGLFNISIWGKWKCIFICFCFMVLMEFVFTYVVGNQFSKRKYLLELIKGWSKVHQKNMSQERGLNFDQWKTFFFLY